MSQIYTKIEKLEVNDQVSVRFQYPEFVDGEDKSKIFYWPSIVTEVFKKKQRKSVHTVCKILTIGLGEEFEAYADDLFKLERNKPPPSWGKTELIENDYWAFAECLAFKAWLCGLGFGESLKAEQARHNKFTEFVLTHYTAYEGLNLLEQFHRNEMRVGNAVYWKYKDYPFWPAIIKKIMKRGNRYKLHLEAAGTGETIDVFTDKCVIPFDQDVRDSLQEFALKDKGFMSIQTVWLVRKVERDLGLQITTSVSAQSLINTYGSR